MRLNRIGGALVVIAALTAGCATGPATTARPSASVGSSPSPAPSPASSSSSSTSPIEPSSSGPAGSPAIHVPVVLDATGSTQAAIVGGDLRFVAMDGGEAACRSLPDSLAVADITALELGELGSGTLRAMWAVPAHPGAGSAELFIDGGDLPEQSFQPFWNGRVQVTSSIGNGASGSLTFTDLELESDAGSKPGLPPPGGVDDWPATLSGTLSWTCDAWFIPISSEAPTSSAAP